MHKTILILLLIVSVILFTVNAFAIVDAQKSYEIGVKAYEKGQHKKAINLFEQAIKAGISGGQLRDAKEKIQKSNKELTTPDIKVNSRPSNAKVYLDGAFKGKTPAAVNFPPGKYRIKISLDGYYDWKSQIELIEGNTLPIFVQLSKKSSCENRNKTEMDLLLEVQTHKAIKNGVKRIMWEMKYALRKEHIPFMQLNIIQGNQISIKVKGKKHLTKIQKLLDIEFKELRIVSFSESDNIFSFKMDLLSKEIDRIIKVTNKHILETIYYRIYQLSIAEPDIQLQGEKRISIKIKGVINTQRVINLITKTAHLKFQLVDDTESLDAALKGNIPPHREILYNIEKDPDTNGLTKIPFLLHKRLLLNGKYLSDARVQFNSKSNEPYISINFYDKRARILERITDEKLSKRLAIILDNNVYSVHTIQESITNGHIQINGRFTDEEAHDLAILIRSGHLLAPVIIVKKTIN